MNNGMRQYETLGAFTHTQNRKKNVRLYGWGLDAKKRCNEEGGIEKGYKTCRRLITEMKSMTFE